MCHSRSEVAASYFPVRMHFLIFIRSDPDLFYRAQFSEHFLIIMATITMMVIPFVPGIVVRVLDT